MPWACTWRTINVCDQLAQGCTQQRCGWDSNQRPIGRKSGTIPLRQWATPYKCCQFSDWLVVVEWTAPVTVQFIVLWSIYRMNVNNGNITHIYLHYDDNYHELSHPTVIPQSFYHRDAVRKRGRCCWKMTVCPSVCRRPVLSKQLNLS